MAINNIKPFATLDTANIVTDSQLASAPEMQNGFGYKSVANSAIIGKLVQNATAGAYAVGQLVVKYAEQNVEGSNASALAINFETAIKNIVSQTAAPATWGNITGTLADQTDLQTVLDAKQDSSTAFTKAQADALYIALTQASSFATVTQLNTGLSSKLGVNATAKQALADGQGRNIVDTYALITELPDLTPYALTANVNTALSGKLGINDNAVSATKAAQDKNGKDITTQYVAKSVYDAKVLELTNLITALTTRVTTLESNSVNKSNAKVTGSITIE